MGHANTGVDSIMDGPMGHANTAVDCIMDGPMGHANTALDGVMDGPMGHTHTGVGCTDRCEMSASGCLIVSLPQMLGSLYVDKIMDMVIQSIPMLEFGLCILFMTFFACQVSQC